MEMLVVIAVIGVITAVVVTAMRGFQRTAKLTTTAYNLESFGRGFTAFYHMNGGTWPADNHNELPTGVGLERYIHVGDFNDVTPVGGRYNWDGPSHHPFAGISLTGTTATVEELREIDQIMDDGNLSTGAFRRVPNGSYTYVISETP